MMTRLPLVDRALKDAEVERIRLLLSTYQDGTGMLATEDGGTLPGWRDFERSVACALNGIPQESKAVFDVILAGADDAHGSQYGISCKMRRELNRVTRDGRVTIELSNAAGEFWDALGTDGVHAGNYFKHPAQAGMALSRVVQGWHSAAGQEQGGSIDLTRSCYLVLLWNKGLEYQLFQYPLALFDATKLDWFVPRAANDPKQYGRRLCGADAGGTVVEWYGHSGGQLKVYPLASEARWQSAKFRLEPLPKQIATLSGKADRYFPAQWRAVSGTKG